MNIRSLKFNIEHYLLFLSTALSVGSTICSFFNNYILAYGDAESHINIAKRVITSITPGAAQLGGIWLPLPHVLMVPFVKFNILWQTGLGGSIVSGVFFIIASIYLYKLTYLMTSHKIASLFTYFVFVLNPNILYMQSTPMTELPLISLFILSTYYFFVFLKDHSNLLALIFAAGFGLCATLTRYDGWLLVAMEAGTIVLLYLFSPWERRAMSGRLVLFATIAFFGIVLWLFWNFTILGDPLYFTNSPFSAKSQQKGWLGRGELPTYHDILTSFAYFMVTSLRNTGSIVFIVGLFGIFIFLFRKKFTTSVAGVLVLLVPFFFYVLTLYIGQSVIFIPDLTPTGFSYNLFNVRYGLTALPTVAFGLGFLWARKSYLLKGFLAVAFLFQLFYFYRPGAPIPITLADGLHGLSSAKLPNAQAWIQKNYNGGLVLMDDYSKTISVARSGIPMDKIIYIGNKPYWEESLKEPEKYASWIIMQKGDPIWNALLDNPNQQARLYRYFSKSYTSPEILIFQRQKNKSEAKKTTK